MNDGLHQEKKLIMFLFQKDASSYRERMDWRREDWKGGGE